MKKLLILGGNPTEIEIVTRAKAMGYYTIVADNHEDWSLSPAKQVADEGWDISWSDVDSLEKKCIENNVSGVLAGFSEFRVENMIKLCSRLNLPCSLTMAQLDVTRDKILFKETCRKYEVKTVPEYKFEEVHSYPVIIKPVDRAGSIGINVAYNKEELERYYQYALSLSPSKQVIIEDFITDGIKFDVYYYVQGETIIFLGSSDTIMCKGDKGAKILQKCWPFKSKYENLYRENVESHIKDMFIGLGIKNAYATMSAFYLNGNFYFFESGFRLSGEMSFNYYEAVEGINYVNTMARFAVGDAEPATYVDCSGEKCHSAVLNFFGVDGNVAKICGLDELQKMKDVYAVKLYVKRGDCINNHTNIFSKIAMVTLVSETRNELVNAIDRVNRSFDIQNEDRQSVIYERVTSDELGQYYKV